MKGKKDDLYQFGKSNSKTNESLNNTINAKFERSPKMGEFRYAIALV